MATIRIGFKTYLFVYECLLRLLLIYIVKERTLYWTAVSVWMRKVATCDPILDRWSDVIRLIVARKTNSAGLCCTPSINCELIKLSQSWWKISVEQTVKRTLNFPAAAYLLHSTYFVARCSTNYWTYKIALKRQITPYSSCTILPPPPHFQESTHTQMQINMTSRRWKNFGDLLLTPSIILTQNSWW